jgi:3-hydroxyisobutyrate dehydrogenase-like beta-hydroxyacid dehydrogenase
LAELGFVGLGAMGGTVAKRLLDAGHNVYGWNRTPEKAQWLVDQRMTLADSPRDVAERSEVVFAMVTDTKALNAVTRGPDGILPALRPGRSSST